MSATVHSVLIYSRSLSAITRLFVILNRREVVGVGTPIELLIQPSCGVCAASLLQTPLITEYFC